MDLNYFLNEKGRTSSTKTTEKHILKNFPDDYILIKSNSERLGISNKPFPEKIFYYINGIENKILCENCQEKPTRFLGVGRGYAEYCSSKCSNSSLNVIKKKENSYLDKFGVTNPSYSKNIVEKIKNTYQKNYKDNSEKYEQLKKKIQNTNLEKYGVTSIFSKESPIRKKIDQELLLKFQNKYKNLKVISYEEKKWGNARLLCSDCGNEFEISKWNLHQRTKNQTDKSFLLSPCTICNPIGSKLQNNVEKSIKSILDEIGLRYKQKDRKILDGKEIDFLIEEKKVAIEIDGLYWHSDLFKHKNYHLEKSQSAEEKGFLLIHVFEDEINFKFDLVKSRILSILGIYEKRIYARQCKIVKLETKSSNKFLEENHMQGPIGSKLKYGLLCNNELVSVMTFGDLRKSLGSRKTDGCWELIRFCNKKGYQVIGGASKLLKYFIEEINPAELISFSDSRWGNGDFYEKIGFKKIYRTPPNYWYVKNGNRENRFKYRKDVLKSLGFDEKKSESEIMKERGYCRIYDCGSFKFVYENKQIQIK